MLSGPIIQLINEVRTAFSEQQFSSKFFYSVRQDIDAFTDEENKLVLTDEGDSLLEAIMVAKFLANREQAFGEASESEKRAYARAQVKALLSLSQRRSNKVAKHDEAAQLQLDAGLLIRFLASQAVSV